MKYLPVITFYLSAVLICVTGVVRGDGSSRIKLNSDEPDWKELVARLEDLAKMDGLDMIRKINQNVDDILESVMRAAKIFATAIAFGPDSNEQKTITASRVELLRLLKQTNLNIRHAQNEININIQFSDFQRDIMEPKELFRKGLDKMSDPKINKSKKMITNFVKNYCSVRMLNPLELLTILRFRLEDCLDTTNKHYDEAIIKWKQLLRRVAQQKVRNTHPRGLFVHKFNNCSDAIFGQLSMLNVEDSLKAIYRVEAKMTNSDVEYKDMSYLCTEILSILYDYTPGQRICSLETILQAKLYRHEPLNQFSTLVGNALIELLLFASSCVNVTYTDNPSEFAWYKASLRTDATKITDALLTWIPQNLNRSWPDYEKELINDILEFDQHVAIQPDQFMAVNKKIFANLAPYGMTDFKRQILISTALQSSRFMAACSSSVCFGMLNVKNAHILVTRFNSTEYRRSFTAQQWLIDNKPEIRRSIIAHRNAPLQDIGVFYHRETRQHLLQEPNYRSMVILRDTGAFYCDTTDFRIFGFGDGKIFGSYVMRVYVNENPGCTELRVIFFI